ncbi:MAG: hypothetical protein JO297_18460 [Nitrososphaeraceae archaeon]|nr:hypothetical protein [Nitrososphaeraceae archaeon]
MIIQGLVRKLNRNWFSDTFHGRKYAEKVWMNLIRKYMTKEEKQIGSQHYKSMGRNTQGTGEC